MPQGDGTGPAGQGPMTGRALGYCAGYNSPGFTKGIPAGGRGFGRGFGRGRGFAWRARTIPIQNIQPAELTKEQEKKILEAELAELESEKTEMQKRLKELKSK